MIVDAGRLQLRLAEAAVVLEAVGVRRAADDELALPAQLRGQRAVPQHVVEDDDVGPVDVGAPVVGLRHEAGGDLALLGVLDVVLRRVAFLGHLPGDVADQAVVGHEQELAGHAGPPRASIRARSAKLHARRPD